MQFENYFTKPGAYVLVDGQFGSTGKGLFAAYLAQYFRDRITVVTTNAGPNSGHTAYWDEEHWGAFDSNMIDTGSDKYAMVKVMTQQIPVASVWLEHMGRKPLTYINAGAIIDADILMSEGAQYGMHEAYREGRLIIHPIAAAINEAHREADKAITKGIAGTGKGIGPAIADKVLRVSPTTSVARDEVSSYSPRPWSNFWDWEQDAVFVETAQGFSLSLNEARFFPCVTSRECTVGQALSDARIPPSKLRKVFACIRTFPIRVGNTEGSSGGGYDDQVEMSWEEIGVEPELTTVTKRVRRVFSWSWIQFEEMLRTNEPDVLFINFMNYIKDANTRNDFLARVSTEYVRIMGRAPDAIFLGHGPLCSDIERYI